MGRSAESKLDVADRLDKRAVALAKRDAVSAAEFRDLARVQRRSAIRQMKRRPKRKRGARLVV